MTRNRYKVFETEFPYFITCTVINWLSLLKSENAKLTIIDSIRFIQKEKGVKIFAYVIMDNHLHLIISSENPVKHIANFKSFTARKIIDHFKEKNDLRVLKQLEIKVATQSAVMKKNRVTRSAVTRYSVENRKYRLW